jgi:energy-coupling factor transport system ATP-binding protein
MSDKMFELKNVSYIYKSDQEAIKDHKALNSLNLKIEKGQFVVIIGRNGSGKSTLSRLLNALLIPTEGTVLVKGMDTRDPDRLWEIRRSAGMVFQNPDNQIVGTVVEEDVAFGPENMGVEPSEIRKRVDESLKAVGIYELKKNAPHLLSGGQKQRVAIAGILAMKPECIILDEATSMLDPVGRREVMGVLKKLNKAENITIIHVTHYMDEAAEADRVIIIDNGKIVMDGKPGDVFSNVPGIKNLGLDVPQVTELFYELNKEGYSFPTNVLNVEDAGRVLAKAMKSQ